MSALAQHVHCYHVAGYRTSAADLLVNSVDVFVCVGLWMCDFPRRGFSNVDACSNFATKADNFPHTQHKPATVLLDICQILLYRLTVEIMCNHLKIALRDLRDWTANLVA